MQITDVIENGLYELKCGSGWCKHGLVITYLHEGEMLARDTYWSNNPTTYRVTDIIDNMRFLLDMNNAKDVSSDEYMLYSEGDRVYIPVGGWHERYLVNRNAEKKKEYIIDQLQYKIQSAEHEINSRKRDIERWTEELNSIK